jgi:hypothetical protein
MTALLPIDFAAVAARADLRALVESDLGPPDRSRKWRCPFHDDHSPSLGLTPDGRRFKCWSGRCGATGTALDWLMQREGLSIVEAAKALDPSLDDGRSDRDRRPAKPKPAKPARVQAEAPPPAWTSPEWQAAVDELVGRAEADLWSSDGREALAWLHGRGLEDFTIRMFRLGFLPDEGWTRPVPWPGGTVAGIHHERGILVPWVAPGAWYTAAGDAPDGPRWCGANVRRLMPDVAEPWTGPDKCRALRGSERGNLYPLPDVLPTQGTPPALLVEGEIDALLGWQEAGPLAFAGTVGGASQTPRPSALGGLARCPWLLLGFDHDEAGLDAVRTWRERAPHKARRVLLPHGKDVGEFVQAGGDVAAWLASEFRRLGLPWPLHGRPAGEALLDLTSALSRRGIRLDGEIVYPCVAVGTITGRVGYTAPAVQIIPEAGRLERITPVVEGRRFVRADFGQVEPRILLAILRRRGLIAWDVGPDEDLYRVLAGEAIGRDAAKVAINRMINGGRPDSGASGKLAEFTATAEAYRAGLATAARAAGSVRTLAGRKILLAAHEANFAGKCVNRVVQGSAADIFNRACVAVHRAIEAEGIPAAVAFVLFDELWVESDPSAAIRVEDLLRAEMAAAALADDVMVPVRITPEGALTP